MTAIPQTPPSKPNPILFVLPIAIAIVMLVILVVMLTRRAPDPETEEVLNWLADDSTVDIRLLPGAASPIYAFRAEETRGTLIAFESSTPGFQFAAQVQDDKGELLAEFDSAVEIAAFALAPRAGRYEVKLTAQNAQMIGTVNMAIGAAAAARGNLPSAILSKAAPPCQVQPAEPSPALVRSAPSTDYEVITTLSPGAFLPVLGRTDDGWYAVNVNERMSWMAETAGALVGTCSALPRLLSPVIPEAPADAEVYLVEVDRDGSGQLRDAISTPQGDRSDIVWVRAINLYNFAPNNYREFALTLNCTGRGAEYLRWGSPYEPTLRCGDIIRFPFLYEISQQPIAVVLTADAPQSYVEYMLTVTSSSASMMPAVLLDASGAAG